MRSMVSRFIGKGAAFGGAVSLTLVALLLPAAPAHALPSGESWAGSWGYFADDAFSYTAKLPGLLAFGRAADYGGARETTGFVLDTADDGLCTRVILVVLGRGHVGNETACGSGTSKGFDVGAFRGPLVVVVTLAPPNSTQSVKTAFIRIPDSTNDPTLTRAGSGAEWSYYTGVDFKFSMTRPGVAVAGIGTHQSEESGQRSLSVQVTKTTYSDGCSTARVSAQNQVSLYNAACLPGPEGSNGSASYDFRGWIDIEACSHETGIVSRCLGTHIPQPM